MTCREFDLELLETDVADGVLPDIHVDKPQKEKEQDRGADAGEVVSQADTHCVFPCRLWHSARGHFCRRRPSVVSNSQGRGGLDGGDGCRLVSRGDGMQLEDPCLDRDTAKETVTQFRVYVADWKFLETETRIFSNTFKATSPMHNTKVEQFMKMAEESHHELSEMRAIAVEDLSQVIHTSNRGGRQGGAVWRTEHGFA